jgi:hypothetical protein
LRRSKYAATIPDSQIARILVLNQLDREEEHHEQRQPAARVGVAVSVAIADNML